ncbi:ABC transporter permease [Antarcticimicrobium luteum]|uniref:ABC transporter permease n=1 Tax=Antarcticimicrobium luteum TaxID=2547397 RepID=A0A4R5UYH4_9RHOB|nr:ABC transporter permease [Antarcticimicrobium luteum]TDK44389.1 ABC transporter permease [Antarcticimicrobium luteum]
MFQQRTHRSRVVGVITIFELIFHSVVRSVRSAHNNAFIALGRNMLQAIIFVLAFYLMFSVLGLRSSAIRGDFLLYMMSGIFLYMVHTKAVGAIVKSEGPNHPMMQHAPMNTVITITAAAIGSLYIQVLTMIAILFVYHVAFTPITIDQPIPAFGMVLLSWFTGCTVGLVLMALRPWFPTAVGLISTIYQRANMIASGKMFLANSLPAFMLPIFSWNPLFHTIDQSRGFVFINYNPMNSNWHYAFWVGIVLLMIGLMGEFYTRRHASLSWSARR